MERITHRIRLLCGVRAVRLVALIGTAALVTGESCSESDGGGAVPCMSDGECGVVCAADCGDDRVISADCNDVTGVCDCECDISGAGGTGGGAGGMGGGSGAGGGADACGADTECTPDAPSICGTICIDPICGGLENFDTALCGDDGRCVCICIAGDCSDPS